MRIFQKACLGLATLAACALAHAVPVAVLSYDMPNGDGQASGGSFNYWDAGYTGSGATTTDGAALSGGVGKLTDGVVSTSFWFNVSNNAGTGEYVGWNAAHTLNPIINFHLVPGFVVDSITIQLDNSGVGGVYSPASILIDGNPAAWVGPALGTVGSVTLSGLNLSGTTHTVQFAQQTNDWVFVSEVSFDGHATRTDLPEPGTLVLLGAAVAAAGLARRKQVAR